VFDMLSERAWLGPPPGENDRLMPDDFDHEVLDSPEALLRHLYEVHGVEEARDANPVTAPIQFWIRKHAELERDAGAPPPDPRPAPPDPRATATERHAAARPAGEPRPPAPPGPRYRPFADPLVEAVATALVRHGLEERQVRRWIASHPGPDGRRGGEEAVRASFLAPVLEALAARIGGTGVGATATAPAPAATDLDADFMAIADVLQSRRRRSGRGHREPPAASREPADHHDDYMALADAVQHRRGGARR